MADVTLSAAVRSSLLSLQGTTDLIERTQNRLSTGLSVAGPVDDPVKFFQAKTLSDRASDFNDKKDGIDQGISTLTAALDGAEAVEDIVGQLQGLALAAKSATSSTIAELVAQFNDLRSQIGKLTTDTTYQGVNLIDGTGVTLSVSFSTDTASTLTANSVDISDGGSGLALRQALTQAEQSGSVLNVSFDFATAVSLSITDTISVTFANQSAFTFGSQGLYTFAYGTHSVGVSVGSVGGAASASTFALTQVLAAGTTITLTLASAGDVTANEVLLSGADSAGVVVSVGNVTGQYVIDADFTTQINAAITDLDAALATIRTKSQTIGSNVALLQTRLDFTTDYVNTLQTGADKLTLADLNEEGANLLALQTRQQLGISALSFASQAEQGILALFQ
jgi:flagellin-like hook-associated protein FlgL